MVIFVAGCGDNYETISDETIPLTIGLNDQRKIDYETIFSSAQKLVLERLPNAKYADTSYLCTCKTLFYGDKLSFLFIDQNKSWFGLKQQVIFARAVVDLERRSVNITITDESNNYPSLEYYREISNLEFNSMLSVIETRLTNNGITECRLEISQVLDYWHVLVASTDDTGYLDEFGINSDNIVFNVPDPIVSE
jgi:hypothetical protein